MIEDLPKFIDCLIKISGKDSLVKSCPIIQE